MSGATYTSKARAAKGRCDTLFSKIVRARANGRCQNPDCQYRDKGYRLECAHVYVRSYNATRIDFDNAFALCAGCHRWFTNRPLDFAEFCRAQLGEERYQALRMRAVGGEKIDWEAEADLLKAMWQQIERAA